MRLSRLRIKAILRWIFLLPRPRSRWRDLALGAVILMVVAGVNTTCQQRGWYERLEWADLDRLHQTAEPTGGGGVSLVLIDDEDYERLFAATSPLDPERVVELIAAACRFAPRAVGVDILTSDWRPDQYRQLVVPRLGGCPVIWIHDVIAISDVAADVNRAVPVHHLRLGRVLGLDVPPPDACVAVAVAQPDADGVVRRYSLWHPAVGPGQPAAEAMGLPTLVATLAAYARGSPCAAPDPAQSGTPDHHKIRYTSNRSFPRLPASYLLEAAQTPGSLLAQSARELLAERVVIIGGAYRHARDQHRTPIGFIHGSELIASAVHTELAAPIADVRWWESLSVDLVVGMLLLSAVTWAGLRWPWASAVSVVLTVLAAIAIAWHLYNYLGYFLGVLAGLAGVVLAVLSAGLWEPVRDMLRSWMSEFPREPNFPEKGQS